MKRLVLLLSIALWFGSSLIAAETTTVGGASGSGSGDAAGARYAAGSGNAAGAGNATGSGNAAGDSTARYVAKDTDIVVFNKKTLKYHIPSCTYAKRCTKNCVKVKRSAAKDQGGVPCKVCGAGE
ncbi:MAG: hypothetical protein AB7W16_15930 [Candidatus Obscuribacterales bacterium]